MSAPQENRRVMPEHIDGFTGLTHRLRAHPAREPVQHRKVLPDEQPEFVCDLVELGSAYVGVHAYEVEARIAHCAQRRGELAARRVRQVGALGREGHALQVEALAVDRRDPVAQLDRAKAGAPGALVARFAGVEADLDAYVVQRRTPERVWPPTFDAGHVDGPLDAVLASGERHRVLVLGACHTCVQRDRARGDRVDHEPHCEHAAFFARVDAQHAPVADRDRAGLDDAHRPPDTTRIPPWGEVIAVLERAGERTLLAWVAHRWAPDLDCEQVIGSLPELIADLEAVGEEITFGVADVRPVEPHVALGEHAVELDPRASIRGGRRAREPGPVQDRAVGGRELGCAAPMAGHVGEGPRRVVVVVEVKHATQVFVGEVRPPRALQLHRRQATRHSRCDREPGVSVGRAIVASVSP